MDVRRVGIYYPANRSPMYFLGTPVFVLAVVARLIAMRPRLIHASDPEAMLAAVLYRKMGGRAGIAFNIHDNFALRNAVSPWLSKVAGRIEAWAGSYADVVMVPDETRLELLAPWVPRNVVVTPNSPEDPGYRARERSGPLRIFAGGWLDWNRGFELLGELARRSREVEIVVCGWGATDVEEYVRSLPNIEYLGYVPQAKALEAAASCDLIFAFYNPAVALNRYASPNKLYDALAVGRPVLINSEVHASTWVDRERVGFSIPYGSVQALEDLVRRLLRDPDALATAGVRARELYERDFRWDVVASRVRAGLAAAEGRTFRGSRGESPVGAACSDKRTARHLSLDAPTDLS